MTFNKLDFIICGTQKGGTTALNWYLSQIPGIETAKVKEIHFFDNENINWQQPDYSIINSHFSSDKCSLLCGEATPIYMYWPNSIERIYNYNPNIKLIFCLRHPIYRAYSHWKMEFMRGAENLEFTDAISSLGRKRLETAPNAVHSVYSYIERGFYDQQIESVFRFIPKENCLFIKTEDLWHEPSKTINDVCSFLGHAQLVEIEQKYIVPINTKHYGEIERNLFFSMLKIYEQSIKKCESLTGLDLRDWLKTTFHERIGQNKFECEKIEYF